MNEISLEQAIRDLVSSIYSQITPCPYEGDCEQEIKILSAVIREEIDNLVTEELNKER